MKTNDHANWQEADARVLGQILAAQNVVLALPDTDRIGEFYGQTLRSIPGVRACCVCLSGKSFQSGETSNACTGGAACCGHARDITDAKSLVAGCALNSVPNVIAIPLHSPEHHWGYFVLFLEAPERFAVYAPFLNNLSNYVALMLENRHQRQQLETAQYELERKVAERTHDLTRANQALQCEIGERRQAEEKARQLSERLTLAANAAQFGVWDWDLRTDVMVWDDRMYDLHGLPSSANLPAAWREAIHPDDRPAADTIREQVFRADGAVAFELRVVWSDGSLHILEYHAQVLRDKNRQPLRMIGVSVDITSRRLAAEEVIRLNRELEVRVTERTAQLAAVNRELEAFAYSVSHDLRAPLRHIDGFLALLQKRILGTSDDDAERYMGIILDASKRMGRLIDDLLAFSRMARQDLAKTSVDLGALVRETIRLLDAETRNRAIDWQIGELPVVVGDATLLQGVLQNLLSNAVKFTRPRERPCIAIGCTPSAADEIAVFVRDNGVGFDPKYQSKLFGVFQRLHRSEDFEGTGIGLANVRRIIDRHGGRTWAVGQPDEGATFFFSLPR